MMQPVHSGGRKTYFSSLCAFKSAHTAAGRVDGQAGDEPMMEKITLGVKSLVGFIVEAAGWHVAVM